MNQFRTVALLGGLNNLFSTHPPMEKRIARLRGIRGNLAKTSTR